MTDWVTPVHYKRGPLVELGENPSTKGRDGMSWLKSTVEYGTRIYIQLECIDVIRYIPDVRLANAIKYIWRVSFGGKKGADSEVDIRKAIWYLNDWVDNRLVGAVISGKVEEE